MEKLMPLIDLRAGYDGLHRKLEGKPSRYATNPFEGIDEVTGEEKLDDEIPYLHAPALPEPKERLRVKAGSALKEQLVGSLAVTPPVTEAAE